MELRLPGVARLKDRRGIVELWVELEGQGRHVIGPAVADPVTCRLPAHQLRQDVGAQLLGVLAAGRQGEGRRLHRVDRAIAGDQHAQGLLRGHELYLGVAHLGLGRVPLLAGARGVEPIRRSAAPLGVGIGGVCLRRVPGVDLGSDHAVLDDHGEISVRDGDRDPPIDLVAAQRRHLAVVGRVRPVGPALRDEQRHGQAAGGEGLAGALDVEAHEPPGAVDPRERQVGNERGHRSRAHLGDQRCCAPHLGGGHQGVGVARPRARQRLGQGDALELRAGRGAPGAVGLGTRRAGNQHGRAGGSRCDHCDPQRARIKHGRRLR